MSQQWRVELERILQSAKREVGATESEGVRDAFARIVGAAEDGLEYGSCRHCGKKLSDNFNCCAPCEDERGP